MIVVSHDGRAHLERCLPALARTAGVAFEMILADNGSSDGTAPWARAAHPEIRVLALERNLGFGEANRRGVAATTARLVAFLNSDTVVEPGWLAELVRVVDGDATIGAACSTLLLLDRPGLLNARGGGMTRLGYGFDRDYLVPADGSPFAPEPAQREVPFPTAAAMLMRRADFLDLDGFDPAMFMYHEDVDLGWRLWIAGRRVVVCRDSVVHHACGGTSLAARGSAWKERLGARHNVRALIKNYQAANVARALAGLTALWLRQRAIGHALHAAAWNLAHLPSTLRARSRVQRSRRVSDAELLQRGLVCRAAFPPPPPSAPRPAGAEPPIPTPLLLPGRSSALGRLGPGWHASENDTAGALRWTCGRAACRLHVTPGATGSLTVTASLPAGTAPARTVRLSCNGAEVETELPPAGWRAVSIPVTADSAGRIEIVIDSPVAERHDLLGDHDYRRVGCAVREVRFDAATSAARPAYTSVSVIVPTYNRWPILRETLAALAEQTWRDLEVIVVDDGSTDDTWERLAEWGREHNSRLRLTPLHQENLKPGRARNLGLRHATGDLVVFLGDDTVPDPGLVAAHVARHQEIGEPMAVVGFTDWYRERMRVTPFLEHVNRDGQQFAYGHFTPGEDVPYTSFYTSNVSVPRWVLGESPFHPAFTFVDWEDVELGYRLSRRGLRIVYHPAAVARHVHPMSMAGFFRRQVHVGRTVDVLVGLHPELAGDAALPPLAPARWFPILRYPVRALVPLLSLWDRAGLPLPRRAYRAVLLSAYFTGREKGYGRLSPAEAEAVP